MPPGGDLRLPDHPADPHRRGAVSAMVKKGDLTAEFLNVESEFAALSVAIGASATGARAYTATASQGLLYMSEAVYNAAGLGPADRDDGRQPRDRRADQHLERPQRRDVPARRGLAPALRRDQPGSPGPAHPGVQDRRTPVGAGHGVHGRLPAHPRQRAGRHAGPGPGGRVPAAVRPAPGARPGRAGLDRRHGRPRGVHRGPLPGLRAHAAGAAVIPAVAAEFAAEFGRTPAAWSGPT